MFWTKDQLMAAIDAKDPTLRNYFDTFGFVVLKGFLNKDDFKKLLKEYDHQYAMRTEKKEPWKMLLNRLGFSGPKVHGFKQVIAAFLHSGSMRFLPDFVDSSEVFCDYFFQERMLKIYRYFAGEDFLYLGSDGSHFLTTSFPWHRDWYTRMPNLKMNVYFNPLPFFGGKFMLIPGSNFVNDSYAQLLQKAMSWPMQNKRPGGLSENSFLPDFVNPRQGVITRWITSLKITLGLAQPKPDVPHVSVKLDRGDVVIFDQRLIHCVQANFPSFSRRLLTVLLAKNAYEFSDDHYLLKQGNTRESLMREIVDLVVSERNHINCAPYGEALYKHPFSKSKNFISVEKMVTNTEADNSRYNVGSFPLSAKGKCEAERFVSQLDVGFYASIGSKYRSYIGENQKDTGDTWAQAYSYQDVHLGVNSQNIKKVSNR